MINFSEIYKHRKKKLMLKKIMSGGLNVSAFILLSIFELGKISIESFHPKKYCFTALGRHALGLNKKSSNWKNQTMINNLSRLIKSGLVIKDKAKKIYVLSDEGKRFTIFANDYFSSISQKWDGYLRIVFYDIPMTKSDYRRWLYNNLLLLGYMQIQKSVLIGKYPLPASLIQDISNAELDDYIYISTIKNINNRKEILSLLGD
jgi:hypothetical protein